MPLDYIWRWLDTPHNFTSYFSKIHSNIILQWGLVLPSGRIHWNFLAEMLYASCACGRSHNPLCYYPSNIKWRVHTNYETPYQIIFFTILLLGQNIFCRSWFSRHVNSMYRSVLSTHNDRHVSTSVFKNKLRFRLFVMNMKWKAMHNNKPRSNFMNALLPCCMKLVCISYPCNRPCRPTGFTDDQAPHISGEVVSFTRRRPFTPGKIPGTHFC
jgi:hypothetical protein